MTAPTATIEVLAHNFNLGVIDFFDHFKRPPQQSADGQSLVGQSLLHDLAREDDVLSVETLLDKGAEVDLADDQGRTPLHEAAFFGSTGVLALLLDMGATRDAAVRPFGHTALYFAVERGHVPAAQLLIGCGAKLDVADSISGQGLLHMAAAKGDMRLAGILIAAGIDVFTEDKKGRTARDYAARHNHKDLERAILKVMEHRALA